MLKEIKVDNGSSIFRFGFEGVIKKLYLNENLSAEEKELWVNLYFLRRDKSYLKGHLSFTLTIKEDEKIFEEKIKKLEKQGFLEILEGDIFLLEIK